MSVPNSTFRSFVEKLGGTDASEFVGDEGDLFWNPEDASLRISDGTTPGGVAVTGVTTVGGGGGGPISQNLIPDGDGVYDLGSPTAKWKDLYLTNTTMYLGSTPISIHSGSLAVDGETIPTTNQVKEAAESASINARILANTDRMTYSDGAMATVNPNLLSNGGWYHATEDGSYIRWNFWTPIPNTEVAGDIATLETLESGWCLFYPWSTNSKYPFFQFYTMPKRGDSENHAGWYRSRVTYSAPDETHTLGEPKLLYFGTNPNIFPGIPRVELTLEGATQGPMDPDEQIFSSYVSTSTGLNDNDVMFSTPNVGFQYSNKRYNYSLYAVPDGAAGINTSFVAANGTTFEIKDGLIIGMT